MDLKTFVENLNFGQRKELYFLLRNEFETFGYKKDGDMTVKAWMAKIPKGEISEKLSDYLKKQEGRLIAHIDIVEVARNLGKRGAVEFIDLRGY